MNDKLYAGPVGIEAPDPVAFDPQTCGPLGCNSTGRYVAL